MTQIDFTDGVSEPKQEYPPPGSRPLPASLGDTARLAVHGLDTPPTARLIIEGAADRDLTVTGKKPYFEAAVPGLPAGTTARIVWSWPGPGGDTVDYETVYHVEMVPAGAYAALSLSGRELVHAVWWRFADLFDNTLGGKFNFYEQYQSAYGLGRIAEFVDYAARRLGALMLPPRQWSATAALPAQWSAVFELAAYVEALRHAMRTYVEQPDIKGASVAVPYADRRDYLSRWKTIVDDAQKDLDGQVKFMRQSLMDFRGRGLLVSGGIYGRQGVAMAGPNPGYVGRMHAAWPVTWAGY